MKINILYLYNDLMNLYGESGNIKAITNYLKEQNIKTNIIEKSIQDEITLEDIDLIYIGSGMENNQLLALEHLKNYKEQLKEYIENNGYMIIINHILNILKHIKKIVNLLKKKLCM